MAIFFLTFVALAFGFLLIFVAGSQRKKTLQGEVTDPSALTLTQFEKLSVQLVEAMKLEIDRIERMEESGLDIYARNLTPIIGGCYIIHSVFSPSEGLIDAPQIIEFSNMVLQERASKGIFITTGRFADERTTIAELAPMEFIDGARFQELVTKYRLMTAPADK